MYIQLETERLQIRPIALSDAAFILKLVNTEGWLTFIGDRKVNTIDAAEQYIQKILGNPLFYYNIFQIKGESYPIGIITFLHRATQAYPDIGFAMLPQFEGQGFAFEACKKYLEALITHTSVKKILAITLPENRKSISLIMKLGLEFEDKFVENDTSLYRYAFIIRESNHLAK